MVAEIVSSANVGPIVAKNVVMELMLVAAVDVENLQKT